MTKEGNRCNNCCYVILISINFFAITFHCCTITLGDAFFFRLPRECVIYNLLMPPYLSKFQLLFLKKRVSSYFKAENGGKNDDIIDEEVKFKVLQHRILPFLSYFWVAHFMCGFLRSIATLQINFSLQLLEKNPHAISSVQFERILFIDHSCIRGSK